MDANFRQEYNPTSLWITITDLKQWWKGRVGIEPWTTWATETPLLPPGISRSPAKDNAGPMAGQRRRRWPGIGPALSLPLENISILLRNPSLSVWGWRRRCPFAIWATSLISGPAPRWPPPPPPPPTHPPRTHSGRVRPVSETSAPTLGPLSGSIPSPCTLSLASLNFAVTGPGQNARYLCHSNLATRRRPPSVLPARRVWASGCGPSSYHLCRKSIKMDI